jgi:hypothetical protein
MGPYQVELLIKKNKNFLEDVRFEPKNKMGKVILLMSVYFEAERITMPAGKK